MISFLIVNWNGGETFKRCIHSVEKNIAQARLKDYEIVVVDNKSYDLDASWLLSKKYVRFHQNERNTGFASGTNKSVEMSNGDYLFFLNNDVILNDGSLLTLLENLYHREVDAVVPKMVYPDGRLQYSIRGFPTITNVLLASLGMHLLIKKADTWFLRSFNYLRKQKVEQPMFSALMVKREVWNRVGKMDERLPLLFNDVDWFHRFREHNLNCFFIPDATVTHFHGMSVNKHQFKKIFMSVKSMVLYLKKYNDFGFYRTNCLYAVAVISIITRTLREILITFYKR
jgi:GT2 family glycosyltransferase